MWVWQGILSEVTVAIDFQKMQATGPDREKVATKTLLIVMREERGGADNTVRLENKNGRWMMWLVARFKGLTPLAGIWQ